MWIDETFNESALSCLLVFFLTKNSFADLMTEITWICSKQARFLLGTSQELEIATAWLQLLRCNDEWVGTPGPVGFDAKPAHVHSFEVACSHHAHQVGR